MAVAGWINYLLSHLVRIHLGDLGALSVQMAFPG